MGSEDGVGKTDECESDEEAEADAGGAADALAADAGEDEDEADEEAAEDGAGEDEPHVHHHRRPPIRVPAGLVRHPERREHLFQLHSARTPFRSLYPLLARAVRTGGGSEWCGFEAKQPAPVLHIPRPRRPQAIVAGRCVFFSAPFRNVPCPTVCDCVKRVCELGH